MKSAEFEYHRPETREAALELLSGDDAMALAGGQSLMPMMNFRLAAPEKLVDLNAIGDLSGISTCDGWLNIGAMTRYREIERSTEIATHAKLVMRAVPQIAHAAIRNRGTLGGSCALADPAAEMPAVLLALNGAITVQNQAGQRRIAADDFFLGLYETARAEDELLVTVHIPLPQDGQRIGFHEITRRHGDYAMAGCAIAATTDFSEVRIAFFGVSDRAIRAVGAETALTGSDGGDVALAAAVEAVADLPFNGDLHTDARTKIHLAGVALRRAWAEVMA